LIKLNIIEGVFIIFSFVNKGMLAFIVSNLSKDLETIQDFTSKSKSEIKYDLDLKLYF